MLHASQPIIKQPARANYRRATFCFDCPSSKKTVEKFHLSWKKANQIRCSALQAFKVIDIKQLQMQTFNSLPHLLNTYVFLRDRILNGWFV